MVSSREMELLSRQLNQAHRSAIQEELAARGLREIGHPMLLSILESSGPEAGLRECAAQRDLAQMLHISPAAVANSLKSLEKGGYIRREPGPGDARRNRVILTEKGREAVEGCRRAFETVACRMLSGFTQEEQECLLSFRRRMLQNLWAACGPSNQKKEES